MRRRLEIAGYAGVVLMALGAGVRLVVADSGTPALALVVSGLALFLVYFFGAGDQVTRFLSRRSTREGGNALGTAAFLLGALVVVNLLGASFRAHLDVTADRLYTLAPETVSMLERAMGKATVWSFYPEGSPEREALRQFGAAARLAVPGTRVELVDPDRDPGKAADFGLTQYTGLVETADRRLPFTGSREEDIVGALRTVLAVDTVRVAFLYGHGEAYPEDGSPGGGERAGRLLHRRGAEVRRLSLLTGNELSDGVDLLIVAGARSPLAPAEEDSVAAFLRRGGRVLLNLDPARGARMERVLAAAGLRFEPSFLEDRAQADAGVLIGVDYSGHPVVRDLRNARVAVALRGVGALVQLPATAEVRTAALLWSGPGAVARDDPAQAPSRRILAAAAELANEGRPGRLVAVADADYATNEMFETLGNGDLFLGAAQWLLEQEGVVALRPRERTDRPISLSRQQGRALIVVLTLFAPLAVLGAGAIVLWRRR